jgi:hypothetical protein
MNSIRVFLEVGKKRTFAGAIDWPGWSRSGRDEDSALQALIHYGSRYAQVLQNWELEFHAPIEVSELKVTERHEGNATTDFGAPAVMLESNKETIDRLEFERYQNILQACWGAFDGALERATGKELRKGPRGGGRDLEKILDHVLEADRGYLSRLAWKYKREDRMMPLEGMLQSVESCRRKARAEGSFGRRVFSFGGSPGMCLTTPGRLKIGSFLEAV